jgi:uncharacterized protein (TIGR02118 family)
VYLVTVVYDHPTDPAAFDAYYRSTHVALVRAVPDLLKFTAGHCDSIGGPASAYLLAQLYFESADVAGAALNSPQGQTAAADLANFADGGVTMLFSEERIVTP